MPEVKASRELLLELTSEIVSSQVAGNAVAMTDLPDLITAVHSTLSTLGQPVAEPPQEPAVPVGKSVRKDSIVCLECGRRMKVLRRHLRAAHGQSPEEYRAKWNLPYDYPVIAQDYSVRRQELANEIGLGRKPGKRVRKGPAKRSG